MAILVPAFQTPYIASVFEELPATVSFGRGMRFAMSNKGTYLKLGVLYTLVMLLSRYIPMVNILVQLFVPTYLYTTLQMYCMDHGLSPAKAVRRPAHGTTGGKPPMPKGPKADAPKKPKANAAKGTGA
jgi:hypothetical protein